MIYSFGGWVKIGKDQVVSDLIEAYDPVKNQWIEVGKMTEPRWAMGLAFANGKFYLFGGWDKDYNWISRNQELEIKSNDGY